MGRALEDSTMTTECIFCRIVDGEIPSHSIYEGSETLAFLDANPLSPGHALVIPREHHERLNDVPGETASALYETLHRIVPAVEESVDADATTVAFNNGTAAGQEVPHVHGHVVPRFEDDGGRPIHAIVEDRPDLSDDELDRIATDVSAAL
jgi:histidine triad (HIT) family protein